MEQPLETILGWKEVAVCFRHFYHRNKDILPLNCWNLKVGFTVTCNPLNVLSIGRLLFRKKGFSRLTFRTETIFALPTAILDVNDERNHTSWPKSPPLDFFQTMSGRPRTTSFAEGGKAGGSAPFGGMKTISTYLSCDQFATNIWVNRRKLGNHVICWCWLLNAETESISPVLAVVL